MEQALYLDVYRAVPCSELWQGFMYFRSDIECVLILVGWVAHLVYQLAGGGGSGGGGGGVTPSLAPRPMQLRKLTLIPAQSWASGLGARPAQPFPNRKIDIL